MTPEGDLPQVVRRGTGVVFAAQVASQIIALATLACLARLVTPEAFGVIGVALPIVMLPRIAATLGFSTAAVQDARGSDAILSALFWRTAIWSLAAALITAGAGALFSSWYTLPALTPVAAALGLGTLVNAMSIVHLAVLERQLHLRAAALIRLAAQGFAAIVAVVAGWMSLDVWALVLQHVVELIALAIGVWSVSSWRPSLRHLNLPVETRRFGGWYALSSIATYAAQHVDKLVLFAWLGTTPRAQALLGMYAQAYNLMIRPVFFVTTPVSGIMLPTLSRVQHDPVELAVWTERFYRLTALMLLPAGVGLWLTANDLMPLLAPRWPESGVLLTALAPIILVQGFVNLGGMLLASVKRSGVLCLTAVAQLVFLAQAAWGGASFAASDYELTAQVVKLDESIFHQTLGAATGVALVSLLTVVPYMALAFYLAGVPLSRFFRAVTVPLAAALAMGVVVHLIRETLLAYGIAPLPRLAACMATGVIAYGGLTYATWRSMLRR